MLRARLRTYLARHRALHRTLVLVVAAVPALVVHREVDQVRRQRAGWAELGLVEVATQRAEPGEPLRTRALEVPSRMVPPGALAAPPPPGARARQRVGEGEIVTADDVAGAPEVPATWRLVAVATDDPTALVLLPGSTVDVVAEGTTLASGALVVAAGPAGVSVAVPPADAARVATAAHDGRAVLVAHP